MIQYRNEFQSFAYILMEFMNLFQKKKFWKLFLIPAMFTTCSNSDITINEGKLLLVHELPAVLSENSGMVEYDGLLWFVNDSGNEAVIYGYNVQLGLIERQIRILETVNIDWEEITQDEDHFYIGDFGNNSGTRNDLRIIIVDKSDMLGSDELMPSGIIHFSYADQHTFMPASQKTPFDCEAFLVLADSILLFTKDWSGQQTSVYSLPASAGEYQAAFRQSFDSAGLITGSAYLGTSQKLILLGYSNYIPFLWIVNDFNTQNISFENSVRIDFPESFAVQTEAVVISGNETIRISSETTVFPAQLHQAEY